MSTPGGEGLLGQASKEWGQGWESRSPRVRCPLLEDPDPSSLSVTQILYLVNAAARGQGKPELTHARVPLQHTLPPHARSTSQDEDC